MDNMVGLEDATAIAVREDAQRLVKKAEAKVQALANFKRELSKHWSTDTSRNLGCASGVGEDNVSSGD